MITQPTYDPAKTAELLAEFPSIDRLPKYFFDDLRDALAACDAERARLEKERDEWREKYRDLNRSMTCELRDPNGTIWECAKALQDDRDKQQARAEAAEKALYELHEMVKGECPSLLDEDCGGCSRLDLEIEQALAGVKERFCPNDPHQP